MLDRLNTGLAGRYRLLAEAGAGGMATVYRAADLRHGREVAIKILKPEVGEAIGAARFHAEIATTARLQHPNILPLFDSGEAAGCLFYVMPFVDGSSLRARLQRETPLPLDEALELVCRLASALHYAHQHGVIHRDVKPDNVLLNHGVPVLADFGIALVVDDVTATRLTQAGLAVGTVAYMSPEQATAERQPDPRSDVYSLACVLYQMLSGRLPHDGAHALAIVANRLAAPPLPIRQLRPEVPDHVEAALTRALSRAPDDRFPSADAFAAALRPAAATEPGRVVLRAEPRSYGVLMHEGDDDLLRAARAQVRAAVEAAIEAAGGVPHASPGDVVIGGFVDTARGARRRRGGTRRRRDGQPDAAAAAPGPVPRRRRGWRGPGPRRARRADR